MCGCVGMWVCGYVGYGMRDEGYGVRDPSPLRFAGTSAGVSVWVSGCVGL